MIRAKVIGAGGYGGVGVTELLLRHPNVKILGLYDIADIGKPFSALYPHLTGFCDLPILDAAREADSEPADVAFLATPDGAGQQLAPGLVARGTRVVDYSGDFRFNTPADYQEYATRIGRNPVHGAPELLAKSVYGLAELHRSAIAEAPVVGNPGCFAVSIILGFAPAIKAGLIALDSLIADSKTGVSGAGKTPRPNFHYPAQYDNMYAYKMTGHQHVIEIEQQLSRLAGRRIALTFTPQVVPVCRGILSCCYGTLVRDTSLDDVRQVYLDFYRGAKFVRVLPKGVAGQNAAVRGSNFCDLWVNVDPRTRRMVVISHIDNLMKGQAGSAVQNMNIMFGLDETAGLDRPGIYP
ncbi:MAG: N-acetyl-gamma-glutamyl-phosphate reductase [Candidatus Sumerlaeia bacterium]|nr:N-acetyl-gamma-glutamyl-phosphate reductase [Candidatus Sumerlaeia bacterium]